MQALASPRRRAAYVNRRKGKIICGYELDLKIGYEGTILDGGKTVTATCTSPTSPTRTRGRSTRRRCSPPGRDRRQEGQGDHEARRPTQDGGGRRQVREGARERRAGRRGRGPQRGENARGPSRQPARISGTRNPETSRATPRRRGNRGPTRPRCSRRSRTPSASPSASTAGRGCCDAPWTDSESCTSRGPRAGSPEPGPFMMFDGNIHGETPSTSREKIVQNWRFATGRRVTSERSPSPSASPSPGTALWIWCKQTCQRRMRLITRR